MKMYVNADQKTRIKFYTAEALDDMLCVYLEDPVFMQTNDFLWNAAHVLQAKWTMAMRYPRADTADMNDEQYERWLFRTISVNYALTDRDLQLLHTVARLLSGPEFDAETRADAEAVMKDLPIVEVMA